MATRRNPIGDISKLAVSIAEQATENPSTDQDPRVVKAIEQVLGLLDQRATPGGDLTAVIEASRAAIGISAKTQGDTSK